MSMFIKLVDDIKGDSTVVVTAGQDKIKENHIEVNSFSYSASQPTSPIRSNTGPTSTRPSHSLFNFTKLTDKASPLILQWLWEGKVMPTVTFYACREDGGEVKAYLTIAMTNVVVANFSLSGGGGVPYENVALNYSKIELSYLPQAESGGLGGAVAASWDLAAEGKPSK